jgi:hypothetical protein
MTPAEDFWQERSWTVSALDRRPHEANGADVTIRVFAAQIPGTPEITGPRCQLYPQQSSAVVGRFRVSIIAAYLSNAADPSSLTCEWEVRGGEGMTIAQYIYAAEQAKIEGNTSYTAPNPYINVDVDSYMQITSFSFTIGDGKPKAYTTGAINMPLPGNPGGGRTHTAYIQLTPSYFIDRSYFDTVDGLLRVGYKAAFMAFYSLPNSPLPSLADRLHLPFADPQCCVHGAYTTAEYPAVAGHIMGFNNWDSCHCQGAI